MNNDKRKELLFLTGCINPAGMPFTALQDPVVREQQYIDAISFYLKTTALPILFVENSGTDISKAFHDEIKKGRLEVITFYGNEFEKKLGKGFGEMLIIEKAVKESELLNTADFIFKITGRYKLLNLKSFLDQYRKNDCTELLVDLKHQLQYSDSRFWGSTSRFLKEILIKYKSEINDSENYFFEHALCHAAHEAISKRYCFLGLKYTPRFKGVYGTDNKKYNHSLLYWIPANFRQLVKYKSS